MRERKRLTRKSLLLLLLASFITFDANNAQADYTELAKLIASDGAEWDRFGCSVGIFDVTAVIGAMWDTVNGHNSGSAYIFHWDGSNWVQYAKLLPSDGAEGDSFGWSVAVSGDTAVIGASGDDDNGAASGSAYIFHWDGSNWVQQAKLLPSDGAVNAYFGRSVAICGVTAVIGATGDDDNGVNSGSVYIFHWDGSNWVQQAKLLPPDGGWEDRFGGAVAVSGDTAVIGVAGDDDNGAGSGSAYIFHRDGSNWVQQAKLLPPDGGEEERFGGAVAVSGDTAIIGATGDDDNGVDSGSVYIFHWDGSNWVQQAKLLPSDGGTRRKFGWSVAISGDTAVIGAEVNGNGSAYIFNRDGSNWVQESKLLASDGDKGDWFGISVAISCDIAVIGAYADADNGDDSGSAYIFISDGDNDGIRDSADNCPDIANPGQENEDGDSFGDACDNCPNVWNDDQEDDDGDGLGDLCDWLGDLDNDRDVDLEDFVLFAADWLKGV